MKQIFISLLLTAYCTAFINHESYSQAFIRIYNDHGKKTGKGRIELIADAVLVIANDKKQLQRFLVTEISFIKTKRSADTSIGLGFTAGTFVSVYLADKIVEYADSIDNKGWNAIGIGVLSGMAAGTLIGIASGISTKRQKFVIDGYIEKWKAVKDQLSALPKNDILCD